MPQVEFADLVATVMVGDFADQSSPARHDTRWLGSVWPRTSPPRSDFEYAVVVLEGTVGIDGKALLPCTGSR